MDDFLKTDLERRMYDIIVSTHAILTKRSISHTLWWEMIKALVSVIRQVESKRITNYHEGVPK